MWRQWWALGPPRQAHTRCANTTWSTFWPTSASLTGVVLILSPLSTRSRQQPRRRPPRPSLCPHLVRESDLFSLPPYSNNCFLALLSFSNILLALQSFVLSNISIFSQAPSRLLPYICSSVSSCNNFFAMFTSPSPYSSYCSVPLLTSFLLFLPPQDPQTFKYFFLMFTSSYLKLH